MIRTIKMTLAGLLILVMGPQISAAQGLSANDMAFAFGGAAPGAVQEVHRSALAPQMLSMEEMQATEGEWWPLVFGAARLGTRAVMWAVLRLTSRFVTKSNDRSNHTVMYNTGTKRQICHVGCDRNGSHVAWGAGGKTGFNGRYHSYQSEPWRINPF